MYQLSLIFFAVTFFFTLVLIYFVRRYSIKIKFFDRPGGHKVHKEPMPLGGGVVIFFIVFFVLASINLVIELLSSISIPELRKVELIPDFVFEHLEGAKMRAHQLAAINICGILIFLLGYYDDMKNLKPRTKLLIEILVAEILFYSGIKVTLFLPQDEILGLVISNIITVLWIVGITNAFNLLDHMDGVSAGVAFVSGLMFAFIGIQGGNYFVLAVLSIVIGSVGAFLVYNFPQAKIFMGDAGSLTIGYLFAALSVIFTFYKSGYELYTVLVPLIVFIVPIFDTIWVSVIRIREKRSIFSADNNHICHRLVKFGLNNKQSVLVIYLLTLISGISGLMLYQLRGFMVLLPFFQIFLLLIILIIFETVKLRKAE